MPPDDRTGLENRAARTENVQLLSAITGEGMDGLSGAIITRLAGTTQVETITLGFDEGRKRAWLFEKGLVEEEAQDEDGYTLTVRWNDTQKAQFEGL